MSEYMRLATKYSCKFFVRMKGIQYKIRNKVQDMTNPKTKLDKSK